MNNQNRINYSRKLSDNVRTDLFQIIFEQFFEGTYNKDCLDQQQETFKKIGVLLRQVVNENENKIESKQDLIRVFFAHYYLLFPNMPTSTGALSEIDLMLNLQQEIVLAEAQKADLEEANRVLKEENRKLKKVAESEKSLFSYQKEFRN